MFKEFRKRKMGKSNNLESFVKACRVKRILFYAPREFSNIFLLPGRLWGERTAAQWCCWLCRSRNRPLLLLSVALCIRWALWCPHVVEWGSEEWLKPLKRCFGNEILFWKLAPDITDYQKSYFALPNVPWLPSLGFYPQYSQTLNMEPSFRFKQPAPPCLLVCSPCWALIALLWLPYPL